MQPDQTPGGVSGGIDPLLHRGIHASQFASEMMETGLVASRCSRVLPRGAARSSKPLHLRPARHLHLDRQTLLIHRMKLQLDFPLFGIKENHPVSKVVRHLPGY